MEMKANVISALVALVLGCLIIFWGYTMYGAGEESSEWPYVQGKIVKSKIEGWQVNFDFYKNAAIEYEYTIGEAKFKSARISYGNLIAASEAKRRVLAKYPDGKDVRVYYNPQNMSQAVLEPGVPITVFIIPIIGIIVVTISLSFLGYVYSQRNS